MKEFDEKTLAIAALQAREEGGYGFVSFLRANAKGYVLLAIWFGSLLSGCAFIRAWPVFVLILGAVFGILMRDVSWLVGLNRAWHFSVKVTNWDLVKRLAEEETSH